MNKKIEVAIVIQPKPVLFLLYTLETSVFFKYFARILIDEVAVVGEERCLVIISDVKITT